MWKKELGNFFGSIIQHQAPRVGSWGIYALVPLDHWLGTAAGVLTPGYFWPILYPGPEGGEKPLGRDGSALGNFWNIQGFGWGTESTHCSGILCLVQDLPQDVSSVGRLPHLPSGSIWSSFRWPPTGTPPSLELQGSML